MKKIESIDVKPTQEEIERMKSPHLIRGLMSAAHNGIVHFGERISYQLDPDLNSARPAKRPNFELNEWLARLKEV